MSDQRREVSEIALRMSGWRSGRALKLGAAYKGGAVAQVNATDLARRAASLADASSHGLPAQRRAHAAATGSGTAGQIAGDRPFLPERGLVYSLLDVSRSAPHSPATGSSDARSGPDQPPRGATTRRARPSDRAARAAPAQRWLAGRPGRAGDGRRCSRPARTATSRSRPWCATAWRSTPSSTRTASRRSRSSWRSMSWWSRSRSPAPLFLTISGGILFGTLVGGAAAVVGATIGATIIFLIARSACGESLVRRAGPLRAQARRRLPRRRVQLSAVPAAGAGVSVLAGQSRAGAGRREAAHLRRRDRRSASSRRPSRSRSSAPGSTA